MPFVKKPDSQGLQPPIDARKIFIGRENELLFFVEHILKPEDPTHNILSISGQGGVGKSTLLTRLLEETRAPDFKDYCLTAMVDERQTGPASIMEKFAEQLHMAGEFKKALKQYKEALRRLQTERETLQDTVLYKVPDFAGAAAEGIPIAGPILREGIKATAGHLLGKYHTSHMRKDAERLDDPIKDLTRAFVGELNGLAGTKVRLGSNRTKRLRVLLFFDTFEQIAAEAVPWLLDYLLEAEIRDNVVLVVSGRDPIEHSTPHDPKRWLPYHDSGTIYSISLNGFTEDETRTYLAERNITDPDRIATIWQLSGGLPLYLGLLTSNLPGKVDPTKDVVDNFLRWIPEHEQVKRKLALDAALLSRPFSQDDLEAFKYLPESDRLVLYYWLIGLPFVRSLEEGRYHYHELAQDLFSRHLYQRSRKDYYATRRALADHYQHLVEEIQVEGEKEFYRLIELLELIMALAHQLFCLPDEASHIKAIEQILKVYEHADTEQHEEIARVLRELSEEQFRNQISNNARQVARQLLEYVEANPGSQERLEAATALLEKLDHLPSFPAERLADIYSKRGWAYLRLKDYRQAIADFDRAITLNDKNAWAYGSRGQAYSSLKDYQQAIADFNYALELDPEYAWVYGSRGVTYRLLKEYDRAIADFNRAIELNPQYTWAYGSRGVAYRSRNDFQRAIADFGRAIDLNPQYTWAYGSRGVTYRLLEEYDRAIADFNYALELDPEYAWAYAERGRIFRDLKDYPRAIDDFDRAITLNNKYAWVYNHSGLTYFYLKEFHRAILDFNRALELDPNYSWAYANRGITFLWMKDTKQAKSDYASSCELDKTNVNSCWMAEWSNMCRERPDFGTAERLKAMAASDPLDHIAYVCRGVACYIYSSFEEALVELEQAIPLAHKEWGAYFWQGMAHASLGGDKEAIAAIDKALELGLPPILLTPLHWFEQDRPEFYQEYVVPLLARYE